MTVYFQVLSKTPIKITEAVYTMKLISYIFVHTFSLCCFWRENSPERCIQSASEEKRGILAMTHLNTWLVIASISATASCVIGYNAQCCKNTSVSLAQLQPANADLNLAADEDALNILIKPVIVSNIETINLLFFVFWKLHSKSTWLKNLRGHVPPHSACTGLKFRPWP